jgi:hypothetical protein
VVADETVVAALATDTLFVEWDGIDGAAIRACVNAAWAALGSEEPVALEITVREGGQLRAAVTAGAVSMRDLGAAIGRASLAANFPLIRLEPGRRRLEERFAVVTGFRDDAHGGGA